MTARNAFSAFGRFIDTFGSAVAVCQAIEARKAPRPADLRRLGIDPVHFSRIGRA